MEIGMGTYGKPQKEGYVGGPGKRRASDSYSGQHRKGSKDKTKK